MKNSLTQKLKRAEGFTIIEVVLVLAIAGLIFLMVFIALPALQRSQADTQRRQDLGKLTSEVTTFATNNRGSVPDLNTASVFTNFVTQYLDGSFNDPSGVPYKIVPGDPTAVGQIEYQIGYTCTTDTSTGQQTTNKDDKNQLLGNRKVAAVIYLSSGALYCANN